MNPASTPSTPAPTPSGSAPKRQRWLRAITAVVLALGAAETVYGRNWLAFFWCLIAAGAWAHACLLEDAARFTDEAIQLANLLRPTRVFYRRRKPAPGDPAEVDAQGQPGATG